MDNPKLKFLEDVPWDNSLKLSNGKTIHGLEQLPMVIKFSDDEVFASHVTADKNDFANWIKDVVGDAELAEKLLPIKTKDAFLKFMEQAITDIKNYKAPEPVVAPVVTPVITPAIASVITPVVTPAVVPVSQSAQQSVQQQTPTVQPVIEPIVSQPVVQPITQVVSQPTPVIVSPTPVPVVIPVIIPVSTPVQEPVVVPVAKVPESVVVPVVKVSESIPASIPVSQPITPTPQVVPEKANDIIEEIFDYEDIFKVLITELDQEVLEWDAQKN